MVGNAAVGPVPDAPLAQEPVLDERDVGPVGDGRAPGAPVRGELEPGVLGDDVAEGGLERAVFYGKRGRADQRDFRRLSSTASC